MDITNVFGLLGGVALFLFGMNLMGDGLKKVAGSKLEIILYKLTSNPIKGILLGTGVTAVIQSSSATSVMVVGFVNSGMMKVKQAIGIIMGAIIGTSITGWVICLSSVNGSGIFKIISTDTLTMLMSVVGIVLLMFTDKEVNHNIASILLGFAVLMRGISAMTDAVYPLRESKTFIDMLTGFRNPLIGILIGLAFTCIIQSASAAVGILQALAVTGGISFHLALPVIMGIAIGASVPVLLSALGANTNGKRTALIYLLVDSLGALLFGIVFYMLNALIDFSFMDMTMNMMSIALLNTVFRFIIVLMLTPLIGVLERMVSAIIPEKNEDVAELHDAERLEERFLNFPALAIEQTGIAINSMAELANASIDIAFKLFDNYSQEGFKRVCELEGIVDTYEDKLGSYIVRLMKNELSDEQNKVVSMYFGAVTDLERISDHAKNLAESAQEVRDKQIVFSDAARDELNTLEKVIREILTRTVGAFTEDDVEQAYRIEPLEEITDVLCDEYKLHHVERIQSGTCEYSHGFVFNDILTDMERVGDHCSNLAIALRIRHGEITAKHGSSSSIKREDEHDFRKYYDEYSEEYGLTK